MKLVFALITLPLLAACDLGQDSDPASQKSAADWKHFPVLDDADALSPVKIASVESLCLKVASGNRHPSTAMAFNGQRLHWKATVESVQGRRLMAGAATVRISVAVDNPDEFEPEDEVEITGFISSLDAKGRMILLRNEASTSLAYD